LTLSLDYLINTAEEVHTVEAPIAPLTPDALGDVEALTNQLLIPHLPRLGVMP